MFVQALPWPRGAPTTAGQGAASEKWSASLAPYLYNAVGGRRFRRLHATTSCLEHSFKYELREHRHKRAIQAPTAEALPGKATCALEDACDASKSEFSRTTAAAVAEGR